MDQNLEFNLPKSAYTNFDAVSLKAFMIQQMNEEGTFTDQNYEGSNISSLINILAYYTHVLMFYLNQTSSESSFSEATIYENMNRIVKLIGYKPTGKQTSSSSIHCEASELLPIDNYLIRKYSYFLVDNIQYNFIEDHSFDKVTSGVESIQSINNDSIIYQGSISEYPIYTAEGLNYETLPIVVDNIVNEKDDRFISHGTISVYVKELDNDRWYEYAEVNNLFLSNSNDRVFDLRLNENGHYEVKFGNGVFGKSLKKGDQVSVIYILSDGEKGLISKNKINGNKLFLYNSKLFNSIYSDVTNGDETVIDQSNIEYLTFTNPSNSTLVYEAETVEDIRNNTPTFLSSQLRLVTEVDYEKFLKKSIPNILNDVKVVNNDVFISEYIDYFYKICVDPNKVNRVVLNQVNFADSCDFNNVNIFCVPTFISNSDEKYPDFLSNSFKNLIIRLTSDKKMMSNEIVPRDPIYTAIDIGYTTDEVTPSIALETKLIITRLKNNKVSKEGIKRAVLSEIVNYFDPSNVSLGHFIDLTVLTSNILKIEGVKSLKMYNEKSKSYFSGLSFVSWNPLFEGLDNDLITQSVNLPFFKFPYIYRPNGIINQIEIVDE